jgi:uncharacterized protein (UPF0303 family)
MSIADDIERINLQEARLQFSKFNEDEAWALGLLMRQAAQTRRLPLLIDIRVGNRQLFAAALPGTTQDNAEWVRRKVNTVYRFDAASYRINLEHQRSGRSFDASRGVDPLNYAAAGGGFPVRLQGSGLIGVVTVSGVPQRQDHGFVAECLAKHLKVNHDDIALPPE